MTDFDKIKTLLIRIGISFHEHVGFPREFLILTDSPYMFIFQSETEKLIGMENVPPMGSDF